MTTMQIVGLDPSMSNFGIAKATLDLDTLKFTVDELIVVKTEPESDKKTRKVVRKNSEDLERAKLLYKGAMEHTESAWMSFAEVPVGSQSSRAMASYGISLGVLAAIATKMPMIQVTPTEVKVVATNCKTATKKEMIEAMMTKYPDAPWPMRKSKGVMVPIDGECEHLADAVAAIEAGLATDEFRNIITIWKTSPLLKHAIRAA